MVEKAIGVLHPGVMGVTVGTSIKAGGHRVVWASEGRSEATRGRAADAGLEDVGTLSDLVQASDTLISVCPPHAAIDVALWHEMSPPWDLPGRTSMSTLYHRPPAVQLWNLFRPPVSVI